MKALTVDELLVMYDEYVMLLGRQKAVESKLARAKLAGKDSEEIQKQANQISDELQVLSDSMTYDTPRIWIEYKYCAYKDEPQPILTMHDFRLHCSKPGYICTARFEFLNHALAQEGYVPLDNRAVYPDDMKLSDLLEQSLLDTLCEQTFSKWRSQECYRDATGAVRKWHI